MKKENKPPIQRISQEMINWYNALKEKKRKLSAIRVIIKLKSIEDNESGDALENRIKDFLTHRLDEETFKRLNDREVKYFARNYFPELKLVVQNHPNIFDRLHKFLEENQVQDLLIGLVTHHPEKFLEKFKKTGYEKKGLSQMVRLISSMLDKFPSLPVKSKNSYANFIAETRCAEDASLTDQFFRQLKEEQENNPELVREYADESFFNEAQKKELRISSAKENKDNK